MSAWTGPVWTPTVENVAGRLKARTVDEDGNNVGTFTGKTNPTEAEVSEYIQTATEEAVVEWGWTIPDMTTDAPSDLTFNANALRNAASRTVAARAAALVEINHYPELVARKSSPHEALMAEWETGVKRIRKAIQEVANSSVVGASDESPQAIAGGSNDDLFDYGKAW